MSQQHGYACAFQLIQAPHEPDDDDDSSSQHDDKAVMFMVCIHYICRSLTGREQELHLGLRHPLHIFHGRSSYGRRRRRNSSLPNIPIGLSALILSLPPNPQYRESDISDYMDRIVFCHPGNAARKLIRMIFRIDIIGLQLVGEEFDRTIERLTVNGFRWIEGFVAVYNSEKDLTCVDQALLHENFISSEQGSVTRGEEDCCICLQNIQSGGRAAGSTDGGSGVNGGGGGTYLPCSHVYHYDCIVKWLWRSNFCPLCRTPYCRF